MTTSERVTPMPTFPEFLVGLERRGLSILNGDGRPRLCGQPDALARIDEVVLVATRWHAGSIRLMLAASRFGYVVGACEVCGAWALVRPAGQKAAWCRMTSDCGNRRSYSDARPRGRLVPVAGAISPAPARGRRARRPTTPPVALRGGDRP